MATEMTVREIRAILFATEKFTVIGENEMTNKESRDFLYSKENQDEKFNVIDKGDHLLIWKSPLNGDPIETKCDCGHAVKSDGISTGYAVTLDGKKLCRECCGLISADTLRKEGKLSGYLSRNKEGRYMFSNWNSSFEIPVGTMSKSWHNFAGKNGRTDFWLTFEDDQYHGVQIGFNNQCATIRRNKKIS